jgi:type I restriction enzyme, R subunit
VLLKDDLKEFLLHRYEDEHITASEVEYIIGQLERMSSADLYESNKAVMNVSADAAPQMGAPHSEQFRIVL